MPSGNRGSVEHGLPPHDAVPLAGLTRLHNWLARAVRCLELGDDRMP
jgi:hypothetical protein